jgi:hypothetical protein
MKWNDCTYGCIARRVRNVLRYPPLGDGVCPISAHAVEYGNLMHGKIDILDLGDKLENNKSSI